MTSVWPDDIFGFDNVPVDDGLISQQYSPSILFALVMARKLGTRLDTSNCAGGDSLSSLRESVCSPTSRGTFQRVRGISNLSFCTRQINLRKQKHRVPEWKSPPATLAVAPRAKELHATPQSFFLTIQPSNRKVPPETDRALPAAEDTDIGLAWVRFSACKTLQQTFGRAVERLLDAFVAHTQLAEYPTCLLAKNMAGSTGALPRLI